MRKNNKRDQNYIPYASRIDLILAVTFGCIGIALIALLGELFSGYAVFFALGVCVLYLIGIVILGIMREMRISEASEKSVYDLLNEKSSVAFKGSKYPVIVFNTVGKILWCNNVMRNMLPSEINPIGKDISYALGDRTVDEVKSGVPVELIGRKFSAEHFEITEKDGGVYLIELRDETELIDMQKQYNDERTAIAYIAIDNVEDILQYVQKKFVDAVSSVDDKIKAWAASMNGVIKPYENDKYIMIFEAKYLSECVENRFSILDDIRDTRVGDSVSITVSIGIGCTKGTLADREQVARDAFDLALQRGGDQVVFITDNDIEYYGGRTKSIAKRSNIKSRTFASQFTALIARSDNVIVMGHRYGDFDSFGASVGIARLAMLCGIKANIAVDMRDKNLEPCIEMMKRNEIYEQIFVDNADALDLLGPDTVVVLVDHNTPVRSQFNDISSKAATIVVIDHHRKNDMIGPGVRLSYIEPSASSACELVSEMLEITISSQKLLKEEADMLLSGILLDTKQFTRNTGTRTFGAAQYLRGAGASPSDVYDLFKTVADDLSKEARFHTDIITYKENIAISCCDSDTDESYRVIASKAADKMLMLKGISAAFTLVRIGEHIHISGRSDGSINVQLILEKLGGGGHFDVAGAQIASETVITVLESLKLSIDDYLEMIKGEE